MSDGTPVLGGSYLWNEYKDDYGLVLSASGGFLRFPRLFNTAQAGEDYLSFGSPNERCDPPGPGRGLGGEPEEPGNNCEPLGNVLIIQDGNDMSQPLSSESGGVISFAFDSRVERVNEIGLFNIGESETTIKADIFSKWGSSKPPKRINVDPMEENSYQIISIDRGRVFNVDVNFTGPGAVSFISICVNL